MLADGMPSMSVGVSDSGKRQASIRSIQRLLRRVHAVSSSSAFS
jgi:hypothetical protein